MNHLEYPKGLKPLDIFISSIQKERQIDDLEGMSGSIDYGSVHADRNIELYFLLRPNDTKDYRLLRDSLYDLLDRVSYVVESYQQGKRYSIKIDESYVPERLQDNQTWAEANINCTSVKLPYAESIGTTQDLDQAGGELINYDHSNWTNGYINTNTGADVDGYNETLRFDPYIYMGTNSKYNLTMEGDFGVRYTHYDENLQMTRYENVYNSSILTPRNNEKYLRINIRDYLGNKSDITKDMLGNQIKLELSVTEDVGITTDSELWGYGMGLIDEDTLSYTQTITKGETIDIYNAGNVDVHPFEQELAITISGIRSSNKYFALTNMTNGSEFRATEGIKDGNVITIGRGTVKNNGSHFLRSTTKDFIILSQGNNRFKIDGATSAHVRFDFRFYYK